MAQPVRQETIRAVRQSGGLAKRMVVYLGRAKRCVPPGEDLAATAIEMLLAAAIEQVRLCEAVVQELRVVAKTEADDVALELVLAMIGQGNGGGVG